MYHFLLEETVLSIKSVTAILPHRKEKRCQVPEAIHTQEPGTSFILTKASSQLHTKVEALVWGHLKMSPFFYYYFNFPQVP